MKEKLSYKDLYEFMTKFDNKIDKIADKVDLIHIQATKTNGRVNNLESVYENLSDEIKGNKKEIVLNRNNISKLWIKVAGVAGTITLLTTIVINFLK